MPVSVAQELRDQARHPPIPTQHQNPVIYLVRRPLNPNRRPPHQFRQGCFFGIWLRLRVIPGHDDHTIRRFNPRVGRCQQLNIPACITMFQQPEHDNLGPGRGQLTQRHARQRFSAADIDLVTLTGCEQLVEHFRQAGMKDVLNHQPTDGGIAGYNLYGPGVGPLNHRELADVLDLSHDKRQRGLKVPGLGGNGQQCLDRFHVRCHQAASLMGCAGNDHGRSIQAGHPVQRVRLDGRARTQDDLAGSAPDTGFAPQFMYLGR